jgi:hypothetical protein
VEEGAGSGGGIQNFGDVLAWGAVELDSSSVAARARSMPTQQSVQQTAAGISSSKLNGHPQHTAPAAPPQTPMHTPSAESQHCRRPPAAPPPTRAVGCGAQPPRQFIREQHVCQLALAVGAPRVVAALALQVCKVDATEKVGRRGNGDDAAGALGRAAAGQRRAGAAEAQRGGLR